MSSWRDKKELYVPVVTLFNLNFLVTVVLLLFGRGGMIFDFVLSTLVLIFVHVPISPSLISGEALLFANAVSFYHCILMGEGVCSFHCEIYCLLSLFVSFRAR